VSETTSPVVARQRFTVGRLMVQFQDRPIVPLLILLGLLVLTFALLNPRAQLLDWVAVGVRAAVPLALIAGAQTITMLTGGIDLSVAATASMAGFVAASLYGDGGLDSALTGVFVAIVFAVIIGAVNGIGVGVFRVHPLIMTLGMGLVILGATNAWQLITVRTSSGVPPELRYVGSTIVFEVIPVSLAVFVPVALLLILMLRRTGYGRLLYAIGDNPVAARLAGVKSWQVLTLLYILAAVLAAIGGFLISGLTNVASVTLAVPYLLPSVAAAVIGGTSILGGRGGYAGTIVGALILTVVTSILSSLGYPEAVRQILFGAIIIAVAAGYARVTTQS
jgi:ribose transport system permease protein